MEDLDELLAPHLEAMGVTLERHGRTPIALVTAFLFADGAAHVAGISDSNYPDAEQFQSELADILEFVYGPKQDH